MILKAYWNAEDTYLIHELHWRGHYIRNGDPVKIKRKGCSFRFIRIVVQDGEETLECLDMKSGKCRRFRMSQFDGPVIKRSQRKVA